MTNEQTIALFAKLTALEAQFLDYACTVRNSLSGPGAPHNSPAVQDAHIALLQKVSGMLNTLSPLEERKPVVRIDRTKNRGFASMSPAMRRRIAGRGGSSAHRLGRAHEFSREEARAAGQIGVLVRKGLQPLRNP